jgi:hypothetical protein
MPFIAQKARALIYVVLTTLAVAVAISIQGDLIRYFLGL